jgi:tRNA threonylcarbamoyladenosine modification (KEOPS) complex Cgi121 subunit
LVERGVLSLKFSLQPSAAESLLSVLRKKFPKLTVQLVTLDRETNARLLEFIGHQTINALAKKSLLADKPEVDLLLRLASTTQIGTALKRVGYGKSGNKVLVAIGERSHLLRLRRYCMKHLPRPTPMRKSPLSARDLEKVELAALLSARKY